MIVKVKPKGEKPFQVHLEQATFKIGRSSQNDLKLSADPALSRFHAEIQKVGGVYFISDLESRNGTFVNGNRIKGKVRLTSGDRIGVGETEIVFGTESMPFVTLDESSVPTDLNTTSIPLEDILHPVTSPKKEPAKVAKARERAQADILPIITQAGRELIQHRPLEEVFELIMDLVFKAIPAERACLMLREGPEGHLVPKVARDVRAHAGEPIKLSSTIAKMVVEDKKSVVSSDAQTDKRFSGKESIVLQGIRSAMCVPLWNNRAVTGLIYLDTQEFGTRYTDEDVRLLTILGNIAAVKIENDKLVQAHLEKKRMEEELEKAAQIQRGFLPVATPEVAGLELSGFNIPCQAVGGDSFDLFMRDETRLVAAIADVSGKGMPAALLMAHLQAAFRAWQETGISLPDLLKRLNQTVIRSNQINKFVSFFIAEIDRESGRVDYCNAGHNPPYVVKPNGDIERLRTGGLILGVLPETDFEQDSVTLGAGDLVLMYSDGLTESTDPTEEQYGEARLEAFLKENHQLPVADIQKGLEKSLKEFTAGAPQADDLTIVMVKKS